MRDDLATGIVVRASRPVQNAGRSFRMAESQDVLTGRDARTTVSPALLHALVCPDCRKPLQSRGEILECSACGVEFGLDQGVPKLLAASRVKALTERIEAFRDPHREIRSNSLARALIPPNPICDPGERSRHARVKE